MRMTQVVYEEMYHWTEDLFPIRRSISGEGVRQTLRYVQKLLPDLTINEVSAGSKTLDWTVPDEWNICDAYVEDESGNKLTEFKGNNLHLLRHS
jgi:aminopeptidase-like protein